MGGTYNDIVLRLKDRSDEISRAQGRSPDYFLMREAAGVIEQLRDRIKGLERRGR